MPRLKWDLTEVALRNFLTDEETIGVPCTKYRAIGAMAGHLLRYPTCGKLGPNAMAQLNGTLRLTNGARNRRYWGRLISWTGSEVEGCVESGGCGPHFL